MTAIAARRRRRTIAAVVTSIASAIALPSGLVVGANSLLNESGGNKVDEVPAIQIPKSVVQMIAVTGQRGDVASVAVWAVDPSGRGGTIVSLPVGAAADVSADEPPRRIADSYLTGGLAALRADVEDLLNITLDGAEDYTAAEMAGLLGPVGTQPVTLPQPVLDRAADAEPTVVLEAGTKNLSATDIANGLSAINTGTPESTRLPQVKALWSAVARAGVESMDAPATSDDASATSVTATTEMAPDTAADATVSSSIDTAQPLDATVVMSALLAGEIDVWQIASTMLTDPQRNPSALDLYALDGGEALMVMASVAPSALTLLSENISVMVDVPFDDVSITREAVTRLAYLGANVSVVRRLDEQPVERTVVLYQDPLARTEVETFSSLMGSLEFVEADEIIAGIDVRIVLGNDFKAFLANGGKPTTSTTTSPSSAAVTTVP